MGRSTGVADGRWGKRGILKRLADGGLGERITLFISALEPEMSLGFRAGFVTVWCCANARDAREGSSRGTGPGGAETCCLLGLCGSIDILKSPRSLIGVGLRSRVSSLLSLPGLQSVLMLICVFMPASGLDGGRLADKTKPRDGVEGALRGEAVLVLLVSPSACDAPVRCILVGRDSSTVGFRAALA